MTKDVVVRAGLGVACLVLLVGCPQETDEPAETEEPGLPDAQQAFWGNLEELCDEAYPGELIEAPAGDTTFVGRDMVMHVRECEADEIRIPFHVGEDRSRTWVVQRLDDRLRLKHDHRHPDGVEEELTWYGGDTQDPGSETAQEFPADQETIQMVDDVETNIWTLEVRPGEMFAYSLSRHGETRYRVEFDLTETVEPTPPAPWGFGEDGEVPEEEAEAEDDAEDEGQDA